MYRLIRITSSVFLLSGIFIDTTHATHLRAGEITATQVDCHRTVEITLTIFTNLNTSARVGGAYLYFGDGESVFVQETENTVRQDLGENIGTVIFQTTHVYRGPGRYVIYYTEANRNEGVLNMDQSVNTTFYLETEILINPFFGCNNTPILLIPPIDRACSGVAFFHNPGAYDPDGDSLSYELAVPFRDQNLPVTRYQDPSANTPRTFYTNYSTGNEVGNSSPTFQINPQDGTLTWDAPGALGEYNIAFVIREWRKVDGEWTPIGSVRRDMQILVEECDNKRPDLILPADTCVVAGEALSATILGFDPENDDVKIDAYSEIFSSDAVESPATYSPNPAVFQSSINAKLEFDWQTTCNHVRDHVYQVVFKITDKPDRGPQLVTFKTWQIKVIGPSPEWSGATLDKVNRHSNLTWENYPCSNAVAVQVWRRVSSDPYEPGFCETGMPAGLGYEKVAELPSSNGSLPTTFTDTNNGKGLEKGATYCYRLVAIYVTSGRTVESILSDEICIDPIDADAPVITHVSVLETDTGNGVIEIKWLPPFDIDPIQFPGPFEYVVQRADGFTGTNYITVHPGRISTNEFQDVNINTENNAYNYRILLYDASLSVKTPIDTSSSASSVRLEASQQLNSVALNWEAFVPWSNNSPLYPTHDVFRGLEGQSQDDFVLVSSVQVNNNGFVFVDNDVTMDQTYCYRVMTRGTYGNPEIDEPLENFSQLICTTPGDDLPPCIPKAPIAINPPDCNTYANSPDFNCNQTSFSNHISWSKEQDPSCRNDIAYYNVYVSSQQDGIYDLIETGVKNTFYMDLNLPSYARCYKISAVDHSGNESELSDPICIDNCPYYELPNIFTPNEDCWNNLFSAYSDRDPDTEPCSISFTNKEKCARFVEQVVFTVFNRWGEQVYSYVGRINSENSIYIDWNGHDDSGQELSSGVYYYQADVTFITIDPTKQNKTLKGWVQILK